MDKQQTIYFVCGIVAISLLCLTVIFPAIDKKRRHPGVVEEEGTIVQQKVVARQAERPQETKSVSGAGENGTAVQQKVAPPQAERPQETKSVSGAVESKIPEFQVTGREDNQLALLVPQNTTSAELEKLIYTFKKAREENHLGRYFPPTTPNDKRGKYAVIGIYVFSDKANATTNMLKQYLSSKDAAFAQTYAESVLAYYYYGVPEKEFGCLGLIDSKIKPTKKYMKLFSRNYQW
jgi:hypothetical protein